MSDNQYTVVFDGDIRKMRKNLFEITSPFGEVVACGAGNEFARTAAQAAEGEREFQRYIKELDECTKRAEAAEAREREAVELMKEARWYVDGGDEHPMPIVSKLLARIDAFLKGDGDE